MRVRTDSAAATAELFGLFPQVSTTAVLVTLPEALWEAFLGIWLTVKGFRPSPIISAAIRQAEAGDATNGRGPQAAVTPP